MEEIPKEVSELSRSVIRLAPWLAAILVVTALGGIWLCTAKPDRPIDLLARSVKSGNLSVDYSIGQALSDVKRLSLNTVNIPVIVKIDDLDSSTMSLDPDSILKARELMKELRERGITMIVEPYPWIGGGQFYETDWNPSDVDVFFANWTSIVKELLEQVVVPERAAAICVASNLIHLEHHEDRWSRLIDEVRDEFDGLVTYKTNWWYTADWDDGSKQAFERKLNNPIFGKVDFISIAAYFELSDRPVNTVDQLKADLLKSSAYSRGQNIVGEIERLHGKWNKPVFLGELGFPKREFAARHPWNPNPSERYDGAEQARGFEAYRQTFNQPWFMGFSVFAIGENGEDKNYYPSEESAEVIRNW